VPDLAISLALGGTAWPTSPSCGRIRRCSVRSPRIRRCPSASTPSPPTRLRRWPRSRPPGHGAGPGVGGRRRARAEDRIRGLKDSGLANLPLHDFAQNQLGCAIVALVADLLAWMQTLASPRTPPAAGSPNGCGCACWPSPAGSRFRPSTPATPRRFRAGHLAAAGRTAPAVVECPLRDGSPTQDQHRAGQVSGRQPAAGGTRPAAFAISGGGGVAHWPVERATAAPASCASAVSAAAGSSSVNTGGAARVRVSRPCSASARRRARARPMPCPSCRSAR
jgi:hypothetical protein